MTVKRGRKRKQYNAAINCGPRKECAVDAMALAVLVFGLLSDVVDANTSTNTSTNTGANTNTDTSMSTDTDTGTGKSTTALSCDSTINSLILDILIRFQELGTT
ncbi:hypothetical protein GYMLUDRAFT_73664 [Collybiopsis luxurians FD-317 M1]|uniref:Uncharacterized protein n=1 Tax=Collybiopsis luxurians FD-317 M1 TaxID=944289 RepID=A0A0D0BYE6_9AGAR|nr:hypothetical protein GYMLUDRAFT_73664 [Collybiopsis luxurians FD-317 M1]